MASSSPKGGSKFSRIWKFVKNDTFELKTESSDSNPSSDSSSLKFYRRSRSPFKGRKQLSRSPSPNSLPTPFPPQLPSNDLPVPSPNPLTFERIEFGLPCSRSFRLLLREGARERSPWHDVPLYACDGCVNFVCTTAESTWIPSEPASEEPSTPLKFPLGADDLPLHFPTNSPWNLGIFPKTYLDPQSSNETYGGLSYRAGPVLGVEILGRSRVHLGEVYPVKPLAGFALVDSSSRLRWLLVCLRGDHPLAPRMKSSADVERSLGSSLREVRDWFRTAETYRQGDPPTLFGLNERAVGHLTASRILASAHDSWQLLIDRSPPPTACSLPLGPRPAPPIRYERYWAQNVLADSSPFLNPPQQIPLSHKRNGLFPPSTFPLPPPTLSPHFPHEGFPSPKLPLDSSSISSSSADLDADLDLSLTELPRRLPRGRVGGRVGGKGGGGGRGGSPGGNHGESFRISPPISLANLYSGGISSANGEPLPLPPGRFNRAVGTTSPGRDPPMPQYKCGVNEGRRCSTPPPGRSSGSFQEEGSFSFPVAIQDDCQAGSPPEVRRSPRVVERGPQNAELAQGELLAELAQAEQLHAHFAWKLEETRELLGRLRRQREELGGRKTTLDHH